MMRAWGARGIVLTLLVLTAAAAQAEPEADAFLRGYVSAVISMQFPAANTEIAVREGVVTLSGTGLSQPEADRLAGVLAGAPGFVRLEVLDARVEPPEGDRPSAAGPPQGETGPIILARDNLFRPLIADPRWPHFSAAYQRYMGDEQLRNVGAVSFGETFSLVRFGGPWDTLMEFGVKAGVFAFFDLDAESSDLINADYRVGVPLSLRKGNLSNTTTVFHQSSHLGDEFLLRGRADKRINLSYEAVSSVLSYHFPLGLRAYGGGGFIFRREPSSLDPWSVQGGVEFYSPWSLLNGALRPLAAADFQFWQESGWGTDVSLRAGLQFQDADFFSRKMQLLIEYYNGKSPNGQFYERDIESLGIGLHFFFD